MREKDISTRIVRRLVEFVPPLAGADSAVLCQHWSGALNALCDDEGCFHPDCIELVCLEEPCNN